MSTVVTCDHCKRRIREVAYQLRGVDADRVDTSPVISSAHLHWDCVPLFGRSTERARAMTTGADHYREAEQLLARADQIEDGTAAQQALHASAMAAAPSAGH